MRHWISLADYSYEKLIELWNFPPPSQETVLDMVIEDTQNQAMCYKDCLLPGSDLGCHGVSRIMEEVDKCKKDLLSLCQELCEHITLRKQACYGKVRPVRNPVGIKTSSFSTSNVNLFLTFWVGKFKLWFLPMKEYICIYLRLWLTGITKCVYQTYIYTHTHTHNLYSLHI